MNKQNATPPIPSSLSASLPSTKREKPRLQEQRALLPTLPSHSGRGIIPQESHTRPEHIPVNTRTENAEGCRRSHRHGRLAGFPAPAFTAYLLQRGWLLGLGDLPLLPLLHQWGAGVQRVVRGLQLAQVVALLPRRGVSGEDRHRADCDTEGTRASGVGRAAAQPKTSLTHRRLADRCTVSLTTQ